MRARFVISPGSIVSVTTFIASCFGICYLYKKACQVKAQVDKVANNVSSLINDGISAASEKVNKIQEEVADSVANVINITTTPENVKKVSDIIGKELTNKYLNFMLNSKYDYVAASNSYVKTNETFADKMTRLVYENPSQVSRYYAEVLGLLPEWEESMKKHEVATWNG